MTAQHHEAQKIEAAPPAQKAAPVLGCVGSADEFSGQLPPGRAEPCRKGFRGPGVISVRPYRDEDFQMIDSWWAASGTMGPLPGMMPGESSFIAEIDGTPALAVTVYLTNTPEVAYAENFIANPEVSGGLLAGRAFSDYVAAFAKSRGYKRLLCMTEKRTLVRRYQQLGYYPTLSGVTTLVRNL